MSVQCCYICTPFYFRIAEQEGDRFVITFRKTLYSLKLDQRYYDLINQTYDFPQDGFHVEGGYLQFNGVPIKDMIEKFGTPFKMTYLPKITSQIQKARYLFAEAMRKHHYNGKYIYTYCTKSSHFSYILKRALAEGTHLELSSAYDTQLVLKLHEKGILPLDINIVCNGFKTKEYLKGMNALMNLGYTNVIPILDNVDEIDHYVSFDAAVVNLGVRLATEEEPDFDLYTSRFGIRQAHLTRFYKERIHNNPKFNLVMLHFFIYTGIKDTMYYWTELNRSLSTYCQLKKMNPSLRAINIGGGMPIRSSLSFEYDYEYMIGEIVRQIKEACNKHDISEPDNLY